MTIEDIRTMIEKVDNKPKTLIVGFDVYEQLRDEIDNLHIDCIVSDKLDKKTKAVLVDKDIFDTMDNLEGW